MLLHFKEYVVYNIHFDNIHIMNMSVFLVRQSKIVVTFTILARRLSNIRWIYVRGMCEFP